MAIEVFVEAVPRVALDGIDLGGTAAVVGTMSVAAVVVTIFEAHDTLLLRVNIFLVELGLGGLSFLRSYI